MDRRFLLTALLFALWGISLGVYMGASHDHAQSITHAHILLLGFVVTFIYALIHKLWLNRPGKLFSEIQYYGHVAGALVLTGGLFLRNGNHVEAETVGPVLGIASVVAFLALILMVVMVFRSSRA